MGFKDEFSLDDRCSEAIKIMKKYPSRIPIIVEKNDKCSFEDIDKRKYLVPKDLNMNQFTFIIRKRIKLDSSQAIFLMINNSLCPSNTNIGEIYEDNHDEDGFLYITYSSENTFG
jgi:GABA(A) receptor-associated protein